MKRDFPKPNVIRVAPTPRYNSFHDVWRFAKSWLSVSTVERVAKIFAAFAAIRSNGLRIGRSTFLLS